MIRLLSINIAIRIWTRAISISGKFKPSTWQNLAIAQALVAILCFWAYQANRTESVSVGDAISGERSGQTTREASPRTARLPQRTSARFLHLSTHRFRTKSSRTHVAVQTISSYNWSTPPIAAQVFSESITGTNFISDTYVFFYSQQNPVVFRSSSSRGSKNPRRGASSSDTGFLDVADCNQIYGWTAYENRLNTAVNMSINDGSTVTATTLADNSRSAVGSYCGNNDGVHRNVVYLIQDGSPKRYLTAVTSGSLSEVSRELFLGDYSWRLNGEPTRFIEWWPRIPQLRFPIVVQTSAEPTTSSWGWLTTLALLFQGIVLTVNSIFASVFGWIAFHRGKADARLRQLQIRKTELEVELLEREVARARSDCEDSMIILASA